MYLHCSSGVTRAPTVALIYLLKYKKINKLDNS